MAKCFGDMEPTKSVASTSTSTVAPPSWVQAAGQQNYNQARGILDQGFVPYDGIRTAPLSSDEVAAGNLIRDTASTGNPYAGDAAAKFQGYGAAPGFNYDFSTVTNENGPLGKISDYMSPYLAAVLDPTLRQIGISGAKQRQGIGASATMSGAFGDARHGVLESEQMKNQALQEGDATSKLYSDAFMQALGLRQQDAGRQFSTQQAQEGADKAALERARTSGIDLTNLDKYGVSRALGLASAEGTAGANERSVTQSGLDKNFEDYLRQTGWQDNQIAFLTQILSGTPTEKTTTGSGTQTTSQPNNSGWQALGSLAGSAAPGIADMAAALLL